MTAVADPPVLTGGLRTAWRAVHTPVAGVPRWARIAALTVPLTALPASLWRIGVAFLDDEASGKRGDLPSWMPGELYVIVLSILSELLAFTAVGLVATWGEWFPRWIPRLHGRRIPTPVAVIPATLGAATLTIMWTAAFLCDFSGVTLRGDPTPADYPSLAGGWEAAIYYLCYAPLLLWGPLLAAVTFAYYRRRRTG
ncbi:hypothetical protein GV794_11255 [Nocardia cyriacigeorgica]|uniref:Uncharacterized protein n=1 Tax=Nocardia cyriacigeorgica TaxID=135487 RepID=A0A6P1D437_9NOCA|nr:hypothetical protein [Nocardia cyriacigeorgica]NEW38024.1 hypothetical protein [Nocardia cyriacigeorgica]NEW42932.1 hypothetical protein [Nocardia cyriacigeorgica]NEW48593.1 hypothetical protein [Nocardia cyriacigeorgica]NEW56223.1 hypothetical protein [Nocardia cyriacigeorgica]